MARRTHATPGAARGQDARWRLRRLLALAMMLPALVAVGIGPSQAAGNAGTIKIHAEGSPSGTESNEPHVCGFNVEAFGFDEGFDGYITFEVQGGDGPTGVAAGPFAVGPADADGYFATDYFNVEGGEVIQNGHYKVTLFGKFNDGRINYDDVKAKSKVFKVDCPAPPPPPPPATPTAPTKTDVCEPATGPTDDRITIPADASFTYQVDGVDVAAGEVVATGTSHTVTAVPKPGVVVEQGATTSWTFTFTKVLCVTPPPPATPTAPTKTDVCEPATGPTDDRITIPADANFTYTLDGAPVAAGSVVATGTSHTVTAVPKPGVVVEQGATTSWTFAFTKVLCVTPPPPPPPPTPATPAAATATDVCEPATGPTNDRITIPTDASFTYTLDGAPVAAGSVVAAGTSHTVTAVPKPGVVVQPGATTSWTFAFTKVLCVTPPAPVPATDVLGEQAGGSVGGALRGNCQGTLRARMRNGFEDPVRFTLRIARTVIRFQVRGDTTRRVRTTAPGGARVVLRARGRVIDRMRMPARCTAPDVLPATGLRSPTTGA